MGKVYQAEILYRKPKFWSVPQGINMKTIVLIFYWLLFSLRLSEQMMNPKYFQFYLKIVIWFYISTVIIKAGFLSAGYKSLEIYKLVELAWGRYTIF